MISTCKILRDDSTVRCHRGEFSTRIEGGYSRIGETSLYPCSNRVSHAYCTYYLRHPPPLPGTRLEDMGCPTAGSSMENQGY